MKCPTCMAVVPDDAVFCPQCGARLAPAVRGKSLEQEAPAVAAALSPAESGAAAAASGRAVATGLRRGGHDVAEEELWTGRYSPKAMYGSWAAAAVATVAGLIAVLLWLNTALGWSIFGLAAVLVWCGLLLTLMYRRLSVRYRLTNQRLFHEHGILRRVTDRIETIDIDDVTFEQGILERLFGVGTIDVTSSDRSHPELLMPGIEDVKRVADMIDHARRAERHRRGLYIESV